MDVKWSPKANRDLAGIMDYYRPVSPRAAAKIFRDIESAALRLGRMPLSAPVELLLEDRPEGFRSVVVRRIHKLVYFIDDNSVNIAAVWDCRRDPADLHQSITQ